MKMVREVCALKGGGILWGFMAMMLAVLSQGCAAEREFTIHSEPTGVQVRATADQQGLRAFLIGETPVEYTFKFGALFASGPTMYNLEFSRPGYDKKTVAIRKSDASSTVTVTLDKEVVKEVPKLVVVVSEEKGYVVERRAVRAWIEDIERESRPALGLVRIRVSPPWT